jgi:ribosomal protein L37AE/L43A
LFELEYEIEAQRRHLRLLELERDELYQRQNEGEYDCPYCLYRKLKTGVAQCPSCHTEITPEQWKPIFDFERILAKEWPKKEPESPDKAQYPPKVTKANRMKRTARTIRKQILEHLVSTRGGLIFPILTLLAGLAGTAIYWFWMR